jgi:hypothetical protein
MLERAYNQIIKTLEINTKLTFLILLAVSCTGKTTTENALASNSWLIGTWTGEGKFLNTAINKEIGIVPFRVQINKDHSVSGSIGDAVLSGTSIEPADYGFELKGMLDSHVKKNKDLKKDHLILLLINPKTKYGGVMEIDADFHLKNNFFLDFTMQVGSVRLTKNPF